MDNVISWLKTNIVSWITPPKTIEVIDVIQIILIAYFVYRVILWLKDTRAYALLKGILFIVAFVIIANALQMDTIMWLLRNLSVVAITAVIIIFQPELRRVLEQMGHKNPITSLFSFGRLGNSNPKKFSDQTLNEIVRATFEMAESKIGALIVIEGDTRLGEYEETGIAMDAVASSQLLVNIFEHNTPLHDGAVIIKEDRIMAATCYLPLSENMSVSKTLGTRHRAGLGISEISDSFTIIVSEETGQIALAYEGHLETDITLSELRDRMHGFQRLNVTRDSLFRRREDD